MAEYDYERAFERINEIIEHQSGYKEKHNIGSEDEFSEDCLYSGWVSCISVNISNIINFYKNRELQEYYKVMRSFSSEILRIFASSKLLIEYGLQGSYFYAIYFTPYQEDTYYVANKTFIINTFVKLFNKILNDHGLLKIKIGIGMATLQDCVFRVTDIDKRLKVNVWIKGTKNIAVRLSDYAIKDKNKTLAFSRLSYDNFIKSLENINSQESPRDWFQKHVNEDEEYYTADIVKTKFDQWIKNLEESRCMYCDGE
ncbi:MAG: hypothetical protein Q4E64_09315 [Phascolarctobacterium sp.]|uniref:hypothetical protein n=1 Tax=Phascolarctobacterium sp. TaxID=2049039 RepID=UPI0026DCE9EA|nr:hypothetical protein [Phascolarctobacterium sp.]MDO4922006.1 hypothetical protein [Phascolarctobacterium sp.]